MADVQSIAIVLRVAADRTEEFEKMFEAEELPIWDDFTARGLFTDCSLTRVTGGGEAPDGVQDYVLHIVATAEGHSAHDGDPRFKSFLKRAQKLQPEQPLVWFGDPIYVRRSSGSARRLRRQ
jgi:hypothetical protein